MVKIYTTPTCAYCVMVKNYLTSKNIPFESLEALTAPEYPELAEKHGMSVPLIINGDKGMVGWNLPRLLEVIA